MDVEMLKQEIARLRFNVQLLKEENEIDDFPDVEGFIENSEDILESIDSLLKEGN